MLSLNDGLNYWLYSEPTDMRKSFFTLSGIVTNHMNQDPYSGDVYIFLNKSLTRVKILRMEPGGMVIYFKMLEEGRFKRPELGEDGFLQWRDLVIMIEGIIVSEKGRLKRLHDTNNIIRKSV